MSEFPRRIENVRHALAQKVGARAQFTVTNGAPGGDPPAGLVVLNLDGTAGAALYEDADDVFYVRAGAANIIKFLSSGGTLRWKMDFTTSPYTFEAADIYGELRGANVTSGADPGHTHTHASLTHTLDDAYTDGATVEIDATEVSYNIISATNGKGATIALTDTDSSPGTALDHLLLLRNSCDNSVVGAALKVTTTGEASSWVETALDVSDSGIVLALDAGANDLEGTKWSIDGSTGAVLAGDFVKTGWPDTPGVTLSFDNATMTFTVTDGGSAVYYIDGIKYTLGGNKTVTITDTEGVWYIYFVGATLTASQTPWDIVSDDKALVAYLYWDATNNEEILIGYELHGYDMPAATHARMHFAGGAAWESGLLVTDAGGEEANVSAGTIHDEDLSITITDGAGGALFEQVLSPAELPIYYRDGASAWRLFDTADKAGATDLGYVDGANDLKYNELNGAWGLTTAGNNKYVAMWTVTINDITEPVALLMGQRVDNTLADAKENNLFGNLDLEGLPFEEMVVLARLLLKDTAGGLFYTLEEVTDLRAFNAEGNVTSPLTTDHGGLAGLGDDDHVQYALVDGTRAFTGAVTINATATYELDVTSTGTQSIRVYSTDAGNASLRLESGVGDYFLIEYTSGGDLTFDYSGANRAFLTAAGRLTLNDALIAGASSLIAGNLELDVASGDAIFVVDTDGADRWAWGVEDDAGSTYPFQISTGGSLAAPKFQMTSAGVATFINDIELRDGAVAGDYLVRIYDSGTDGVIDVYDSGVVTARIYANGVSYFTGGDLGIGTKTVPKSAVGYAKLAIEGTDESSAGPHLQFTTATDNYPLLQILPWGHDNISLAFDSYYDGVWKSSDAGSSFRIAKTGDELLFDYDTAAAGAAIVWNTGCKLDASGDFTVTGVVKGSTCTLQAHDSNTRTAAAYMLMGANVPFTASSGWEMHTSGSILAISSMGNCTATDGKGSTWNVVVRKNNVSVFTGAVADCSSTGWKSSVATQARGTDTFADGDIIQLSCAITGCSIVDQGAFLVVVFDD